jgi:hypothetical protein
MIFPTHSSEHPSGMPHLVDSFSARLNSKEGIDLQCLRNSRNSLTQGQLFNNFSREATLIIVSIVGVRITLLRTVLGSRSLFKGRILIRKIRARERSE